MKVCGIVLASGFSRRMGVNKLLMPVNGKKMVLYAFELLKKIDFYEKIIVTAYQEIDTLSGKYGYKTVINTHPEKGQSVSMRLGIDACPECDGYMFFNGDMPYLNEDTINKIIEQFRLNPTEIIVPRYGERNGSPVLFPASYKTELMAVTGDEGGRGVIRENNHHVIYVDIKDKIQGYDIDSEEDLLMTNKTKECIVIIRGGGDLATGTIHCLHQCGFKVLVLETEKPTAIRRLAAFSEAMYDSETAIEGVTGQKADNYDQIKRCWKRGEIPLIADERGEWIKVIRPDVVVDAIIAKKNIGTSLTMAPLVIGLGPGFTAGKDVHVVVETMRGHQLGRLIFEGSAMPNTGIPGVIGGFDKDRVLHAPSDGIIRNISTIGDIVKQGDVITYTGRDPVYATLDGILRGLIRDGIYAKKGLKIADIDPRLSEKENCITISDKARTISGSVLQAIMMHRRNRE